MNYIESLSNSNFMKMNKLRSIKPKFDLTWFAYASCYPCKVPTLLGKIVKLIYHIFEKKNLFSPSHLKPAKIIHKYKNLACLVLKLILDQFSDQKKCTLISCAYNFKVKIMNKICFLSPKKKKKPPLSLNFHPPKFFMHKTIANPIF